MRNKVLVETVAGLSILVLGVLPLAASARGSSGKLALAPDTVVVQNSQTMALLEAHKNVDPTITAGPVVAIVDNTAIDSGSSNASAFADQGVSGTGAISVYTVQDGDTLSSIASMFGVSVNTIRWANGITGSSVPVGTELVILPVSGVRHTVKLGDTLQSIAKQYGADLADIVSYNNLALDADLKPGDVIIVPGGVLNEAPSVTTHSTGTKAYARAADADAFEPLLVNVSKYPSYPGYYARPLAGGIKTQDLHGYNAVDIGSPVGTSVMAAAKGKVIVAKSNGAYNGGYGNYIVISHPNGTQTLYAHLSKIMVKAGESVLQGQVIGAVGVTGWTTGPHLHFEIRGAKNPF